MANLRDIRTRIGTVRNTQQITRAMKMVAAAKLRRAQERIFAARPYAFKLRETIAHLRERVDPASHPLFLPRENVESALLIVVTSDRGLAGAFNANLLRFVEEHIRGGRLGALRDA
ncbi:MAG TPA: F0F1 ATP synthase subunit gamma, partial [Rhodothermales bacterium]|nr:F0F1 ATP synthase subunit gamma [Rhodothermales bacterium]